MKREFVCIVCPKSCELKVEENNGDLHFTGNCCERGITFAKQEIYNPQRVLTTTVKISNGELMPVRSKETVKKRELMPLAEQLKCLTIDLPIKIGQTVDVLENGIQIIATDNAVDISTPARHRGANQGIV